MARAHFTSVRKKMTIMKKINLQPLKVNIEYKTITHTNTVN